MKTIVGSGLKRKGMRGLFFFLLTILSKFGEHKGIVPTFTLTRLFESVCFPNPLPTQGVITEGRKGGRERGKKKEKIIRYPQTDLSLAF